MTQLRECPKCRAQLPIEEFRVLRGRPRRRALICELCEVDARHLAIRRRRKRKAAELAERVALWRSRAGME